MLTASQSLMNAFHLWLQERLASAYLAGLTMVLEPAWALKQHSVYRTNITGIASNAWVAGIMAGVLAELGIASSVRVLR